MLDNGKCGDCGIEPQEAGAPYCDDCTEKHWDRQNQEAYAEFAKVSANLPCDPHAHPMSGRVGDY